MYQQQGPYQPPPEQNPSYTASQNAQYNPNMYSYNTNQQYQQQQYPPQYSNPPPQPEPTYNTNRYNDEHPSTPINVIHIPQYLINKLERT